MLHEKICDSVTLAELTGDEERLFHRLVVKADDYGRFHAHPSLLLGACFPLLIEKIDVSTVRAWRDRLAEVGLISLYTVDGREYLQLVTWEAYQRQRGSKPKFPPPLEEAETRGDLPQAADICGSRVVKTGGREPEDDRRETIDEGRGASVAAAAPPRPRAGQSSGGRVSSGTEPPETLEPTETDYQVGEAAGLSRGQVDQAAAQMLDHWRSVGAKRADWHAALRKWLRDEARFKQPPGRASPSSQTGQSSPNGAALSRASAQRVSYLKAD